MQKTIYIIFLLVMLIVSVTAVPVLPPTVLKENEKDVFCKSAVHIHVSFVDQPMNLSLYMLNCSTTCKWVFVGNFTFSDDIILPCGEYKEIYVKIVTLDGKEVYNGHILCDICGVEYKDITPDYITSTILLGALIVLLIVAIIVAIISRRQ